MTQQAPDIAGGAVASHANFPPPLDSAHHLLVAARRRPRLAQQSRFQQAGLVGTPARSSDPSSSSTMTMTDLLSLSVFQLLSILSFATSVFAVFRMGAGPLHRLSHKFETSTVPQPSTTMTTKPWSWSGLPTSFSLNALIGEDEEVRDTEKELAGYSAGSELVRMDWRSDKSLSAPPVPYAQPPLSMAKIIMSRHLHRKPYRIPRRSLGSPRAVPPSRLTQSLV